MFDGQKDHHAFLLGEFLLVKKPQFSQTTTYRSKQSNIRQKKSIYLKLQGKNGRIRIKR